MSDGWNSGDNCFGRINVGIHCQLKDRLTVSRCMGLSYSITNLRRSAAWHLEFQTLRANEEETQVGSGTLRAWYPTQHS